MNDGMHQGHRQEVFWFPFDNRDYDDDTDDDSDDDDYDNDYDDDDDGGDSGWWW